MKTALKILLSALALCGGMQARAQLMEGHVTDAATGTPLSLVNVYVPGTGSGTVTDNDGRYTLDTGAATGMPLRFSCVGYGTQEIAPDGSGRLDVALTPTIQPIGEITVRPLKARTKRIGNNFRIRNMAWRTHDTVPAVEIGLPVNLKKRARLEQARINVLKNTFDDMVMCLNIYGKDSTGNYTELSPHPIYVRIPHTDDLITVTTDLAPYGIMAEGEIIVAYRFPNIIMQDRELAYPLNFIGHPCLERRSPDEEWETPEFDAQYPIMLTVRQAK